MPHSKFYRFLFPFSSKFSDLNFASYVLVIYYCDTHSEPGLPVVELVCHFKSSVPKTELQGLQGELSNEVSVWQIIGSLSTRVFETRTATGSELFSL